MGPATEDVESVTAAGTEQVVIHLRQPSPFVLDALETTLQKPGAPLVGTGPFVVSNAQAPTEMAANRGYYLGNPIIQRVAIQTFPSVRAAWAEMLRGRIDMLFEVGTDALSSLEASTSIAIFTFTRRYQYLIILNTKTSALQSAEIRRALNMAIDRDAFVRDALGGHGTASAGPVWPHNYGFAQRLSRRFASMWPQPRLSSPSGRKPAIKATFHVPRSPGRGSRADRARDQTTTRRSRRGHGGRGSGHGHCVGLGQESPF